MCLLYKLTLIESASELAGSSRILMMSPKSRLTMSPLCTDSALCCSDICVDAQQGQAVLRGKGVSTCNSWII